MDEIDDSTWMRRFAKRLHDAGLDWITADAAAEASLVSRHDFDSPEESADDELTHLRSNA
jgi:hypothetical protein